mgnify:CR=1 FL=1
MLSEISRRQVLIGGAASLGLVALGCTDGGDTAQTSSDTPKQNGTAPAFTVDGLVSSATIAANDAGIRLMVGGERGTLVAVDRGAALWTLRSGGDEPAAMGATGRAATAPDGTFWVVDHTARAVRHLGPGGVPDRAVPAPPVPGSGTADRIAAFDVGRDGVVHVAAATSAAITSYGPDGEVLSTIAGREQGDEHAPAIVAIVADDDGIWVLEHGRPRALHYDAGSGELLGEVQLETANGHHSAQVAGDHLYVSWATQLHRTRLDDPGRWEASNRLPGPIARLLRTESGVLVAAVSRPAPSAREE